MLLWPFTKTNPWYTARFLTTLFGLLPPLHIRSKAAGMLMVSFHYANREAIKSYFHYFGTKGKGLSIWDVYTMDSTVIADGSTGQIACDSYHLYEADVQMLKFLNVSRRSISFSCINKKIYCCR